MSSNSVPGQVTLPALEDEMGYGSITYLNSRQECFCWELLFRNGNATDSYLHAFPKSKHASANTAAARLLKDERIQQRIREIKAEIRKRYAVNADALVLYLSQVLSLDRRAFLDDDGKVKAASELDTETARILDLEFVMDRHGTQKAVFSIPTRLQASIELARMMGLHKDKIEVRGDGSAPENNIASLLRDIMGRSRDLVSNDGSAADMSPMIAKDRAAASSQDRRHQ